MQNKVDEIKKMFDEMYTDMLLGLKGNKAAQRRARVASIELAKKFKSYREETLKK